ncbi:CDP-diacylglycerol--inositol 3-phosphatidyltransferase [Aphelenchoides bicaudatus]|nr:CDP-diacylglycerol--inositol 3-phosphatidyltransferase [Aphelenchoides bicaudatus]
MANENVFLFYPNLIGYGRIVLAFVAFKAMLSSPWCASICYFLSAFLDAFDGYLARMYNQSSRFGAMLDQLTDRCVFMGLLMTLFAIVDIASHWLHLHATDLTGRQSHKQSTNPILHYYYTSKPFLFGMCFGNEAFYGLLYINHFWSGPSLFGITFMGVLCFLFFPVAFVKSCISLIHLAQASQEIVRHDVDSRAKQTT